MVGLSEGDKRRLLAEKELSWRQKLELKVWRPAWAAIKETVRAVGRVLELMLMGSMIAIGYETTRAVIKAIVSLF